MELEDLISVMTPEIYQRLMLAVELGNNAPLLVAGHQGKHAPNAHHNDRSEFRHDAYYENNHRYSE